jgi:hypothetical protein
MISSSTVAIAFALDNHVPDRNSRQNVLPRTGNGHDSELNDVWKMDDEPIPPRGWLALIAEPSKLQPRQLSFARRAVAKIPLSPSTTTSLASAVVAATIAIRFAWPEPAQEFAGTRRKSRGRAATDCAASATTPATSNTQPYWAGATAISLIDFLRIVCSAATTGASVQSASIALVNAATLIAELGDLSRFANPRQLMAYLGLVPSEHSSGASIKRGGLTKAGNSAARRLLKKFIAGVRGCRIALGPRDPRHFGS